MEDMNNPSPYRFGIILPVDVSPDRSGSWTTLPNGITIWRATVSSPGALALSAYFDKFHLPEGGKLFIYNADRSQLIGAFSSLNNSQSGLFATELIAGDEMTLEYVQPYENDLAPQIHLNELTYAYRGVGFLDKQGYNPASAGKCEVNVNCPEGDNWQAQKNGVTRIHLKRAGGTYWCSGSLVNNTREDNIPYILTANHCGYDATEAELEQWVFYLGYEAPECVYTGYPSAKSMTGATVKAHSGDLIKTGSDFYLVRMNENIPDSFHVFYNGWSRGNDYPSTSGVGIHHPGGDLKKISTYKTVLQSTTWMGNPGLTHWEVVWAQTVSGHGVTEGGSSGSPLFDKYGRIVGALSGGSSTCDSINLNKPDYYGKFSWSWESDGVDSTRRLKDWLDPESTNLMVLDGRYPNSIDTITPPLQAIYPNPFKKYLTISINEVNDDLVRLSIFDITGRMVYSESYHMNGIGSKQLDLGFLPKGLFILRVESQDDILTRKIIKELMD
jgi:hypothetical protein